VVGKVVSIKAAFRRLLGRSYLAYLSFDLGKVVRKASGVVVVVGGRAYGSVPVVCGREACEEIVEHAEFVPSSVKLKFASPTGSVIVEAYGEGNSLIISSYIYGWARLRILLPHPDFPGENVASFLYGPGTYELMLKLSPPHEPSRLGLWGCGNYNIVLRFSYGNVVDEKEAHINLACRLKKDHAIFAIKPVSRFPSRSRSNLVSSILSASLS